MSNEAIGIGDYLASRGGPFFELQRRLGMLRENTLQAGRRAAIFVAIAWGAPLLLSLIDGQAFGPMSARPFLLDFGAWARFFIATGLFVLAEQQVEDGLRSKIAQFVRAPILAPRSFGAAAEAVSAALKRRNSALAEIVCLAAAIMAAFGWREQMLSSPQPASWLFHATDPAPSLTLAGWWAVAISAPVFYFLLFRGIWRYLVWAMLIWNIASLELRLVASHPDGKAGLAFVAEYPNAYAMYVFGLSSAAAIAVVRHVFENGVAPTTFGYIIGGWLAIVLAFFGFPLLAFSGPLSQLRESSLQILGAQATLFHRQAERTLLGQNVAAPDPTEPVPDRVVLDPSAQYVVCKKFSVFLLTRTSLVPIAAAALIPFAIAGATKLPYKEVFALVKKLLVL